MRWPATCLLLLSATAVAAPQPGPKTAPTVQEILARHLQAHGGAARIDALKSLRITGTWEAFSEENPMTILRQRPDRFRFDHVLFGGPAVLGFDGKDAWVLGAVYEAPDGQVIPDGWRRNIVDDARFGCPLLDHVRQGARVELLGVLPVEGQDTFALKVTPADDPPETWNLDPETYLELRRVSRTYDIFSGPDVQLDMETFYMDFRDTAGVQMPYREERHFGTRYHVFVIESVEVNPTVDPAAFHPPRPAGP